MAAALACAVIVAGGSGTRFGNPGGKLLVEIAGRPLLSWTLAAFDQARLVGRIVLVCPDDKRVAYRERAIEPYGLATPISFAPGGATRQDSTRAGLRAVPGEFRLVAVHDGARPLIRPRTIDDVIAFVAGRPDLAGAVCGQPAVDTLKVVAPDHASSSSNAPVIEATPDRARYWTVQTPQVFWRDGIERAFERAEAEGFAGTDDASVAERAGAAVACFQAPRDNMKVTVPEDLVPVDAIMRARLDGCA